jgi:chaperone LolA
MRYLLVFLFCIVGINLGHASISVNVHDIKVKYDNIKTIQGNFIQNQCSESEGTCQQFEGKFYIAKPNLSRMEITSPTKQIIITDSNNVLIYLVNKKKVYIQPASMGINFFKIFDMFLNDTTNFIMVNPDTTFSVLEYKKDSLDQQETFTDLKFYINKKTSLIEKFYFADMNGNENTFELSNITLNPKLGTKLFTLEVPKGTEFIKY